MKIEKHYPVRIVFVTPSFNNTLAKVDNEIKNYFNNEEYTLIVVNDGSTEEIYVPENAITINHHQNKGLAQALLSGYREAIKHPADIVVKVDSDGEYPLSQVRGLVDRVRGNDHAVGGIIGMKRTIRTDGVIDMLFNSILGKVEGVVIFGRPLIQHSPGLHVYKMNTLKKILPDLDRSAHELNLFWGLDLLAIRLMAAHGYVEQLDVSNNSWVQRRSFKKLILQAIAAIKVLYFIKMQQVHLWLKKL